MTRFLKDSIKKMLGEKVMGMMDYYTAPHLKEVYGGPFNGQSLRQKIFLELLELFKFSAIVETGTYRGSTTEFLYRSSRLPVFTVESHARRVGYCRMRLRGTKVSVEHNDSRTFLKGLKEKRAFPDRQLFFYLDAHWGKDMSFPLQEEVKIVFDTWPNSVVMIDDFQVPDDAGYGYDDFGDGNKMTLECLENGEPLKLAKFFPSQRSELETSARRGCVILAKESEVIEKLKQAKTLRQWAAVA
jgi:hypothetical protein